MSNPHMNELAKSGVFSISIIFNSISRYTDCGWEVVKNDEGQRLYQELIKIMNYRVDEVHSTVWQNGKNLRMDTCYSINIEFPKSKKKNELKLILKQLLQITRKYSCAQIVINNQYAVDRNNNLLEIDYLH